MIKVALAFVLMSTAAVPVEARVGRASHVLDVHRKAGFLRVLARDGTLSAGWINVLPALANTCNLRIDNGELTSQLIDLSRESGNVAYTSDLYTRLSMIQMHRADNSFVRAWTARFDGRPKEACDTAEALWGDGGHQFPGILKRDAMNDGAGGAAPATAPNDCK